MKKIISFFAFVAIVLTFAACGGNTPELKDFTIEMKTLTEQSASFTITPADPNAEYFWIVYPKCWYENWLVNDEMVPEEEYAAYELRGLESKKGTATITEEEVLQSTWYVVRREDFNNKLCPNCEFHVAVRKIDANKEPVGDITFYSFNTLMPERYVDLGLPSGNLWTTKYVLQNSQPAYYTFDEANNLYSEIAYYELFPTREIWGELWDYCTWTWGTNGNLNGYWVASKTNGNKIFLPAAGYKNKDGVTKDVGYTGIYWTDDTGDNNNSHYAAIFTNGSFNRFSYANNNSFSVCFYCPDGETYYKD